MGQPEADGLGVGDDPGLVALDFQDCFPVVVRDREGLAVAGADYILDLFVAAFLSEGCAGDDLEGVAYGDHFANACFELCPDSAVEAVLDLRSHVGRVVGLGHHLFVAVAVGIGNLMSAGIVVRFIEIALAIDTVTAGTYLGLLRNIN